KVGEYQHTFWSGTRPGRVSRLPQSGDGQTDKLTAAGSSRRKRHELTIAIMKRIALSLIVGLSATVAQADEFDVVDYGIFQSIDRLPKSYSMRVTGNLDSPVRRALHMP